MVGSIDPDARHSVGPNGISDRVNVWNSRRGSHLGQRPTAGAANRPDIWVQASRSFPRLLLQQRGRPHMAGRAAQAQGSQGGRRGAGQQDSAHRLEAHGDRPGLRPAAAAGRQGRSRLSEIGGRSPRPPRPDLQETSRWLDRSIRTRDTPWDPTASQTVSMYGTRVAEAILASDPPRAQQTGRTYGCKRADPSPDSSCNNGAVHIWVPAIPATRAGTGKCRDDSERSIPLIEPRRET